MLIKRNNTMTTASKPVKNLARTAAIMLVACTSAIAPSAFASSSPWAEKTITVTFSLADLKAPDGTQTVYGKLKAKAKYACRADKATLSYTGQSMGECVDDLMAQFIEDADIAALTAYHLAQSPDTATKTLAMHTP